MCSVSFLMWNVQSRPYIYKRKMQLCLNMGVKLLFDMCAHADSL